MLAANQLWLPKRYLLAAAVDATPPLRAVYSKVALPEVNGGHPRRALQLEQCTLDGRRARVVAKAGAMGGLSLDEAGCYHLPWLLRC